MNGDEAVNMWMNEESKYDYLDPGYSDLTGHLSVHVVAWARCTRLQAFAPLFISLKHASYLEEQQGAFAVSRLRIPSFSKLTSISRACVQEVGCGSYDCGNVSSTIS